jgi:hypothetical protein
LSKPSEKDGVKHRDDTEFEAEVHAYRREDGILVVPIGCLGV